MLIVVLRHKVGNIDIWLTRYDVGYTVKTFTYYLRKFIFRKFYLKVMAHLKNERKIIFIIVFAFIVQALISILSATIYPPDFSKEFPLYNPNSLMLIAFGNAIGIAGLTVMGVKLTDEKKVLSSAGFTMLGILMGLLLVSLFEITQVVTFEAYEKFYRIQASGNFLYLPSMCLISTHKEFKKWIRYIGLASSVILLISSFILLFDNRNFKMLETISNIGFAFMFITFFCWAYNVYINFNNKTSGEEKCIPAKE